MYTLNLQCQDVTRGGLDWAAEAAAAEAGLAAWEAWEGEPPTAVQNSQRLAIEQLRAVMEIRGEHLTNGDLLGATMGLQMGGLFPPGGSPGGAPGGATGGGSPGGGAPGAPPGCPIS